MRRDQLYGPTPSGPCQQTLPNERHGIARPALGASLLAGAWPLSPSPPQLTLWTTRAARSQSVDPNFWVANGPVTSVVRDGSTIYIGGNFNRVGPATGGGVPLDASTAAPLGNFPKVAGVVRAIVPDGSGGWYLGGSFTSVGGLPGTTWPA